MKTNPILLLVMLLASIQGACVVRPDRRSAEWSNGRNDQGSLTPTVSLYFCPNRDIVISNERGNIYFNAYERQRYLDPTEATESGPVHTLTIVPCDDSEFRCAAVGVPQGKTGEPKEVFRILMPLDGAPGSYLKNGVRILISRIEGVVGHQRLHLVNWQNIAGKRQRLSAIWEEEKGLIYITGINLDDMNELSYGETCVLERGSGILF